MALASTLPTGALAQTVSFVSATGFAAGTEPVSVAMGDFNGDWVPDLATANAGNIVCDPQCHLGPGAVSVLLGKGDGTFRAPLTFATGRHPQFVAVGDFNGDGQLDLAVANEGDGTLSVTARQRRSDLPGGPDLLGPHSSCVRGGRRLQPRRESRSGGGQL